tara:strand:- start:239 stop:730 length:492 start_codon:yes stop_codon:yes gene_type:complete
MTIGTELLVNEIGSRQLHQKHKVSVEASDNGFARSRVKDQLFIDDLLMKDRITLAQHREAERIVGLAQAANIYLKSPNMAGFLGGGKPDMMTSGLMRLRGLLKAIEKKYGEVGVTILYRHVIENFWTESQEKIELLSKMLTNEKTPALERESRAGDKVLRDQC